jgi:hypothetical protein
MGMTRSRQRRPAKTGTAIFDPGIIGLVTLVTTVTLFCIFLICLKRGTPQLWPYATEIVPNNEYAIESVDEPVTPGNYTKLQRKWFLNFKGSRPPLDKSVLLIKDLYITPTKAGPTASLDRPGWTTGDPRHMIVSPGNLTLSGCSLNLFAGGVDTPMNDYLYGEGRTLWDDPKGFATNATWLGKYDWPPPKNTYLEPGPTMLHPRAYNHLCQLKDGNVLVSGGASDLRPNSFFARGKALKSMEIYQVKENRFIEHGQMLIPRYDHSVCQLSNGNYLIVSGHTDGKTSDADDECTSTLEIYSPQTHRSWIIGQLHKAMVQPFLLPLKDDKVAILDREPFDTELSARHPYLELYNGKQEPVEKLAHLPSVPELIHNIWHFRE